MAGFPLLSILIFLPVVAGLLLTLAAARAGAA